MAYSIIRFCTQIALSHVHETSLGALNVVNRNRRIWISILFFFNECELFFFIWFIFSFHRSLADNITLSWARLDWLIMFNFPFQMHSTLFLFSIYQTVLSLFLRFFSLSINACLKKCARGQRTMNKEMNMKYKS